MIRKIQKRSTASTRKENYTLSLLSNNSQPLFTPYHKRKVNINFDASISMPSRPHHPRQNRSASDKTVLTPKSLAQLKVQILNKKNVRSMLRINDTPICIIVEPIYNTAHQKQSRKQCGSPLSLEV